MNLRASAALAGREKWIEDFDKKNLQCPSTCWTNRLEKRHRSHGNAISSTSLVLILLLSCKALYMIQSHITMNEKY